MESGQYCGNLHYLRLFLARGMTVKTIRDKSLSTLSEIVAFLLHEIKYGREIIVRQLTSAEFNSVIRELMKIDGALVKLFPILLERFKHPNFDQFDTQEKLVLSGPYESPELNLINLVFGKTVINSQKPTSMSEFVTSTINLAVQNAIMLWNGPARIQELMEDAIACLKGTLSKDENPTESEVPKSPGKYTHDELNEIFQQREELDEPSQSFVEFLTEKGTPISELTKLIGEFSSKQRLRILRQLFENPEQMKRFSKYYLKTYDISFQATSGSTSTFGEVALAFLKQMTANHTKEINHELVQSHFNKIIPTSVQKLPIKGKFEQKIGRTFVMKSQPESKMYHAFKVMKVGELLVKFAGEGPATAAYKASGLFESTFHKPIGIYSTDHLPDEFAAKDDRESYIIYHYKATPGYFEYLHQLDKVSEETADQSRLLAVRDYTTQIRNGIYTETGFFHNAETDRSYLPMPDIMRRSSLLDNSVRGAGRLDAPFREGSSIKYSDTRVKTIADVNDVTTLDQCIIDPLKHISRDMAVPEN